MAVRRKWFLAGALALMVAGAGVGIVVAQGGDRDTGAPGGAAEDAESDEQLTGTDRQRAEEAALEFTGGGTVTEVEEGDDGAAYGVEIRRSDGSQVEVLLNDQFEVTGTESDDD